MASSSDFYYYITIPDTSFNDDIIALIDSREDEQNFSTNIKAKMTSWNLENRVEMQTLKKYILQFANHVSKIRYRSDENFTIANMWGMAYKSEEYAVSHNHWPHIWSACYYINPPKNSSGMYFIDLQEEIKPKNGMLILFPSWVQHEVKSHKFEGTRYSVAANLNWKG